MALGHVDICVSGAVVMMSYKWLRGDASKNQTFAARLEK